MEVRIKHWLNTGSTVAVSEENQSITVTEVNQIEVTVGAKTFLIVGQIDPAGKVWLNLRARDGSLVASPKASNSLDLDIVVDGR